MASTPVQNLFFAWLLVLVCALLSAEAPATTDTLVLQGYVCNTYPCAPPNKTPLFDDKIFDLTDKTPTSSLGISGKERYLGPDFPYNGEQREGWMKACSGSKNEGMASFRNCFEREKQRSVEQLNRRQDDINRERNTPLRNAYPRLGKRATKRKKGPIFTSLPK